jgi:hypothetical protein
MNRSTLITVAVILIAGAWLAFRAATTEMGRVYVREVTIAPEGSDVSWKRYQSVDARFRGDADVSLSLPRTIGLWVSALLTLSIFSFLFGDNPMYRLAESLFIGVSAAYVMVVGFWTGIVQNLFGKLIPDLMRQTFIPGLSPSQGTELIYIVPLILSVMMLCRLLPKIGWIARWPLAFFIGATAGFRLLGFFESDFVRQIQNTIMPLVVTGGDNNFWESVRHTLIVIGVLSGLVYFFFSIEHRGIVGRISRLGIWFLMITFGASFGYTVMGRIALFAQRLEFLLDDWLWIIDPLGRRVGL